MAPVPSERKNGNPMAQPAPEISEDRKFSVRRFTFRCLRVTLAGAIITTATVYTRNSLTTARSAQAYINGEITALRAPIPGQIRIEAIASGRTLRAGTALFQIENARFGNEQALSQLNWVTELAQRLRAESEEAAVRYRQQEQVLRVHERMFAEMIIPRLELVEEQNKLALAGTVMTNKLVLAQKADERVAELKKQAELQETALVTMPFDGAAWAIPARNGAQVALHETVLEVINPERVWVDAFFHERHTDKLAIGNVVIISTPDGAPIGRGVVESIRGGVGRIPFDGVVAVASDNHSQKRVAVRVRLESENPFDASQFFGVGRNVVVTTSNHE